ncbi:hypothetical protein BKA70DRAFT_526729 [Coprinopsis sp. MPI-PUGE-AT-0042]|nr:hypothetical protein BKA70DRAFT_526729 [Coprinopsis sp. MPI-PUGE-AT-0042]
MTCLMPPQTPRFAWFASSTPIQISPPSTTPPRYSLQYLRLGPGKYETTLCRALNLSGLQNLRLDEPGYSSPSLDCLIDRCAASLQNLRLYSSASLLITNKTIGRLQYLREMIIDNSDPICDANGFVAGLHCLASFLEALPLPSAITKLRFGVPRYVLPNLTHQPYIDIVNHIDQTLASREWFPGLTKVYLHMSSDMDTGKDGLDIARETLFPKLHGLQKLIVLGGGS